MNKFTNRKQERKAPKHPLVNKILRWTVLVIIVTALILGLYLVYYYLVFKSIPASLGSKAETLLSSGITIEDPQGDFAYMGQKPSGSTEKPNNPVAYPLNQADVRSVTLAADDKNLYLKIRFWGVIPNRPDRIGEDTILNTGIKVNITDPSGEDQQIWFLSFGYLPVVNMPALNTYYFYDPTGIREPEDARFSGRGGDSKITGGAGTDSILGVFPLYRTGLKLGDPIHLSVSVESSSKLYDHATVDVLGGTEKMPALITWTLGTTDFRVQDDFYTP